MAWLEASSGEKIELGEKCILGRARDSQLMLDSKEVSRRHAMIYRQGEYEYWVADLGSANGTRLNGRHLSQHRQLTDRDKIELGGITYVFRQQKTVAAMRDQMPQATGTIAAVRSFNCWLLVGDIAGSTAMVRKMPEDEAALQTGAMLTKWQSIVEEHHGLVNKFLGDGFLAYWPDSPDTARSVLASLDEFKLLQQNSPSPFRLVLHHGLAMSGGAPSLGEESLLGKEVHFAFRMEKLASTLGVAVLLSEPAASRLKHLCNPQPEGAHALAGFDDTFEFFSL